LVRSFAIANHPKQFLFTTPIFLLHCLIHLEYHVAILARYGRDTSFHFTMVLIRLRWLTIITPFAGRQGPLALI
jgi:hypothetical protein